MMMPGTVCITTHGSRPSGMFCSSSRLTVVEVPIFFVIDDRRFRRHLHLRRDAADDMPTRSGTDAPAATTTSLLT